MATDSVKKKNYGKEFERQVYTAAKMVKGVSIDRIPDQVTRYKGSSSNICDFVAYKYPHIFYLECKTVHGNTLPFSNIRENQWNGLLEKSKIKGVVAGVLCWWVDLDQTWFIPIDVLEDARVVMGAKSINLLHPHMQGYWKYVSGTKRRVLFDYDFTDFFDSFRKS